MNSKRLAVLLVVLVIAAGGVAIFLNSRAPEPAEPAARIEEESIGEQLAKLKPGESITVKLQTPTPGENVPELKYLPSDVNIAQGKSHAMANPAKIPAGTRKLSAVRKISDPKVNGHFMTPKISPDGLQMLAMRPGYQGVYLLGMNGGAPIKISDSHAKSARWTADGRIEITGDDGQARTYGTDGTLESTGPATTEETAVYAENDVIFHRPQDGGAAVPLTSDEDRYFNPVVSPDGESVIYQGLYSGLYMAPADGSGEPVFLGHGNNPVWMPDGSGFVFDLTEDDGHNLTEGDIVYVSSDLDEYSNLTESDDLITQMPSVSPDGGTVVFEADGGIYAGTIQ